MRSGSSKEIYLVVQYCEEGYEAMGAFECEDKASQYASEKNLEYHYWREANRLVPRCDEFGVLACELVKEEG